MIGPSVNFSSAIEEDFVQIGEPRFSLNKFDLLAHLDIADGQCNVAINDLSAHGTGERQSKLHGACYQIAKGD